MNEKRVLITEDRDFGELVYARGRPSGGTILVRFHSRARLAKPTTVVEAVGEARPATTRLFYSDRSRTSANKQPTLTPASGTVPILSEAVSDWAIWRSI
jgi:hypothetical protein